MNQNDPMFVLQLYGLDQILTNQDAPDLWAAALAGHWPRPDDPKLRERPFENSPRFLFRIGTIPDDGENKSGLSLLNIVESWVFARVDERRFRAIKSNVEHPHFILDVSRPSLGTDKAGIHAGTNPAPLIGHGETRVWVQQEDGCWIESNEYMSSWKS